MKVDIALAYELAKFNAEAPPRRRLCDKGMGVFGEFTLYMTMREFTCAEIFQNTEETVPIYFRFARMTDLKSNADSLRDMRTLGARFFGKKNCCDLLCCSSPVFFTDDVSKLPALMKCLKPHLSRDLTNYSQFWDFIGHNPETTYLLLWLFSDRGTSKSFRTMNFYSINTYLWANEKGETFFVRYHWTPVGELKYISRQESEFLAGYDPNAAIRDFSDVLETDGNVEFELNVQILPAKKIDDFPFNPLDVTKDWPKNQAEPLKIGKAVLKRTASKEEEEIIQLNPRNLTEGIGLTRSKLLHAMCVAITDEQRQRLGSSYREPPYTDIQMETLQAYDREILPGAEGNLSKEQYLKAEANSDHFSQAKRFYLSLTDNEKNGIIENILESIMFVDEEIQERVVDSLTGVDEELGAVISMGLDL